jgi:uncharacterized phage protein gp47/JayE
LFFPRTYEDIRRTAIQDLVEHTPVTNMSQSSTALAIVELMARRLADLHGDVSIFGRAGFITTAVGDDLDSIGALFGISRGHATRAYSGDNNFKFYVDPRYRHYGVADLIKMANDSGAGIGSIVIRKGTTISTADGAVSYVTTDDITLTAAGTYVAVVATGVGTTYNVGVGALTRHNIADNQLELSPIARFIACSNEEVSIDTGADYESDNSYRSRILDARRSMMGGTIAGIRQAALSVPGVVSVLTNNTPEGPGTFELVIVTDYAVPSRAILSAVEGVVTDVAAYGTGIIVTTPELLAVELKIVLDWQPDATVEDMDMTKRRIRVAVIDYTNNLPIGGEWIANEVVQRVMEVSDLIKDMKVEYFRISEYSRQISVLTSGKVQGLTAADAFSDTSGLRVIWGNHRCKLTNPPQKFVMMGKHLVVC